MYIPQTFHLKFLMILLGGYRGSGEQGGGSGGAGEGAGGAGGGGHGGGAGKCIILSHCV